MFKSIMNWPPHFLYAVVFLIVGLSFSASWTYFSYQDRKKTDEEKAAIAARVDAEKKENLQKEELNANLRQYCLDCADEEHRKFIKINGTKTGPEQYSLSQHQLDYITKKTKEAKELCFKEYPPK